MTWHAPGGRSAWTERADQSRAVAGSGASAVAGSGASAAAGSGASAAAGSGASPVPAASFVPSGSAATTLTVRARNAPVRQSIRP